MIKTILGCIEYENENGCIKCNETNYYLNKHICILKNIE